MPAIVWSKIEQNAINLEKLRLLCNNEKELQRDGYVTEPLSPKTILNKLRCKNCGNRMTPPQAMIESTDGGVSGPMASKTDRSNKNANKGARGRRTTRETPCEYHTGKVVNLHFTCCQAHVSIQKGCHIDPSHTAPDGYARALEINWSYYQTPRPARPALAGSQTTRTGQGGAQYTNRTIKSARKAIALDCEFGISFSNEQELIRMTAIDFFSEQVLIDSLVKPAAGVKNYMTRYSGVTSRDMRNAVANRSCIHGRDAALRRLLEFVDHDTVLVVHGGSSDLTSLRWIHPHILDTCIMETYLPPVDGGRSLKNLCEKKLGIMIQRGQGHDSREDAFACKELAIWMVNRIPDV